MEEEVVQELSREENAESTRSDGVTQPETIPEEPARNNEASEEDESAEGKDLEEEFLLSRLMEKSLQQKREKQHKRGKVQKPELVDDIQSSRNVAGKESIVEEPVTESVPVKHSKKKHREHVLQHTEPATIAEEEVAEASKDEAGDRGERSEEIVNDQKERTEDLRYHKNRVLSRPEERERKGTRERSWYESSIQAKKLAANGRRPRKNLLKHVKRMEENPSEEEQGEEVFEEEESEEEECEDTEEEGGEVVAHELISTRKRLVCNIAYVPIARVDLCANYLEHSVMIAKPSLIVTTTVSGKN